MGTIYTSGKYLEVTRTWHEEDSSWKAAHIWKMLVTNHIQPQRIVEIGCGVGGILKELSKMNSFPDAQFKGYDISPQAIQLVICQKAKNIEFYCEDRLSGTNRLFRSSPCD